jgi:hypothetical protein
MVEVVLIIDPSLDTTNISSIAVPASNSKWSGGVLVGNDKIYGIPY